MSKRQRLTPDPENETARNTARWHKAIAVAAAVLAIGGLCAYLFSPIPEPDGNPEPDLGEDAAPDPRLTFQTPFRNVHPDITYTGDESCSGCHADIHHTFHQHPMGRSMFAMADVAPSERYGPGTENPFEALGHRYAIERRGDDVFHKEIRDGAQGRAVTEDAAEIDFAVGSGSFARSYLYQREGFLFQSPITWFTQKERWDLSPGYEALEHRFERPVRAECMFCHCDYVEAVDGTLNQFKTPLFPRDMSIGCERCHGPGELHVRERSRQLPIEGGIDHTIVNPRHLEPELRDAVCQQCHLEGDHRVLRRGRGVFDYRPGMPLTEFWSVFVPIPGLTGGSEFVGQVEQFHSSRCFTASEGEMSCVTCHDPHLKPDDAERVDYYARRCLDCHGQEGCALEPDRRIARNNDDCIACHMPRIPSENVNHTAITDHRIHRQPDPKPREPEPRQLRPGELPLAYFHRGHAGPGADEVDRDMGLALAEMARNPGRVAEQIGDLAMPYLNGSLRHWPRDTPALEAKAYLLARHGNPRAALKIVEGVLARHPGREIALVDASTYARQAGDLEKAVDLAERAVEVNPWDTGYRISYASLLVLREEFDQAIAQCRETLAFNPNNVAIRSILVSCYLRTGQRDRAEKEFAVIMRMNPPNADELKKWYREEAG